MSCTGVMTLKDKILSTPSTTSYSSCIVSLSFWHRPCCHCFAGYSVTTGRPTANCRCAPGLSCCVYPTCPVSGHTPETVQRTAGPSCLTLSVWDMYPPSYISCCWMPLSWPFKWSSQRFLMKNLCTHPRHLHSLPRCSLHQRRQLPPYRSHLRKRTCRRMAVMNQRGS